MATRPLTVEEKLAGFVERWNDYHSTEMAGSQSFLHHLLDCYDALDYAPGTLFEQHPVRVAQPTQPGMFEDAGAVVKTTERMDMYIPRICVWEMKGPDKDLGSPDYYNQVLRYWSLTRPRYMVLCNFHQFRIYDTDLEGGQLEPIHVLQLAELPGNPEALNFLRGEETYFARKSEQVTKDAARHIGQAVRELIAASDNPARDRERITKFALECVFAMFAEDTDIIPGKLFENAMKKAQASGDLSPVYTLFDDFGRANAYDRSTPLAPYINGPLFDRAHPKLPVNRAILARIYEAADFDWQFVRPEVFGSIFEQAFLPHERHELGAHFTAEDDIMKVVGPTVVRPWRERIAACKTHKDCEALIERMKHYHVLDPACGSGNFLYVVYREMKRLERALLNRHQELYKHKVSKRKADMLPPPPGPYFSVAQLHGIDKDELAVQLTRVTLWIGQHLASRESDTGEATLPLTDLSGNIIKADALFTDWRALVERGASGGAAGSVPPQAAGGAGVPARDSAGTEARPTGDARPTGIELAIVGNPPFMGSKKMRLELGDEYVDRLHKAYPDNRTADLVTYWYPNAIKTLRKGERAGFVSTNSIAQNESREASLDKIIAAGGTIHDAWKSYSWPGEAAVHVSILNWINSSYEGLSILNGAAVASVSSSLMDSFDPLASKRIPVNNEFCFVGVTVGNSGFILEEAEKLEIVRHHDLSKVVILPYIVGSDFNRNVNQESSRWIIYFGDCDLNEARRYTGAFQYIQKSVYPEKTQVSERKTEREKNVWWRLKRPCNDLWIKLKDCTRYLGIARVSPHVVFSWIDSCVLPDNQIVIITLEDNYHFGVLQSAVHEYWAWARGSTLKGDLRYTNTTIFETFPFPLTDSSDPFTAGESSITGSGGVPAADKESGGTEAAATGRYNPRAVPDTPQAQRVSTVAEELYTKRQNACRALNLGLTKLYNLIKNKRGKGDPPDEGFDVITSLTPEQQELIRELRRLHAELNNSVCACYGWPEDTWRDENEVLTRLLALNQLLTG